ncbi:MAG: hypothetical protein LBV34_17780 [Nocardiopsaceae bacterium]|jgi:hypothetical protein|nr:hypothetical protein [Nocardiopsaceae bacterium]
MRYLTLLHGVAPATPPPPALIQALGQLGQEAAAMGVLVDTAGIAPGAARQARLCDGALEESEPDQGTRDMVAYAVYEAESRHEVLDWTQRFLQAHAEHWPEWTGSCTILDTLGGQS